jgi:hypothetical protein
MGVPTAMICSVRKRWGASREGRGEIPGKRSWLRFDLVASLRRPGLGARDRIVVTVAALM